jgi:hypothetical protein
MIEIERPPFERIASLLQGGGAATIPLTKQRGSDKFLTIRPERCYAKPSR